MFLWLGLILVVIGWFAGSNRYGTAVRTAVTRLEGIGAAGRHPGRRRRPMGRGQRRLVAGRVAVLGVVVLLWGNDVSLRGCSGRSPRILLLAVVQVLVGAGKDTRVAAPPTGRVDPRRCHIGADAMVLHRPEP